MQLVRRLHLPALLCALAVLLCELIAHPLVNMGISDDGPYILMAQHLAATGHIAYNGWGAPMLGWQLYLGAAFIKLFGFSFTAVRGSTVLVAMVLAFLLQRILVRFGVNQRNAILATLTLVLSPLYLLLSVTYMTDIFGLFAIVLCLYGCLRALQSSTDRSALFWLCFAVAGNALCGTSRQIAWLGILVMVPSTLWLFRHQRRVFRAGLAANLAGALFILAAMHWLKHQPYSVPEEVWPGPFSVYNTLRQLFYTFIDLPFLLFPLVLLFLPSLRTGSRPVLALLSVVAVLYALLAVHDRTLPQNLMLMPAHGDWVTPYGGYQIWPKDEPPRFLNTSTQVLLTIASTGGLFGLIVSVLRRPPAIPAAVPPAALSWKRVAVLLGPFSLAYTLLLFPRAARSDLFDRYLLALLLVAVLCLARYYQERLQPRLPLAAPIVIAAMAVYGIVVTHNTFALYRARVALAAELHAHGIPDTSIDNGWDYNLSVELQHAPTINFPTIAVPAHAYVPRPPLPAGTCPMFYSDYTPHIRPLYAVSPIPDACYGLAPFAPMHYSRWPYRTPGTLYVVRSSPPSRR